MDGKGQMASRIATLLAAIDRAGQGGARLIDLAGETGIARPSVHRLLQELAEVGFVRLAAPRRYTLGPALYTLGLSAPPPVPDLAAIEAVLRDLTAVTGDTVYLGLRQRNSIRYLLRLDGNYPVRAQLVEVGQIVPLGATFGGIALLASAGDAEVLELVEGARGIRPDEPLDKAERASAVLDLCRQIREQGFCYSRDFVWPGVSGLATAVPSQMGKPLLSVSVSAVSERLPQARAGELAPHLLEAAARVAALVG